MTIRLPLPRLGAVVCAAAAALGVAATPLACSAKETAGPGAEAARTAYFAGDVAKALKLAQGAGESWIGGLAAFRLKRYAQAHEAFETLSHDGRAPEGVRAAAAYWAYRSADAAGEGAKAADDLSVAAAAPHTFYGMIAERKLRLDAGKAEEASAPPAPVRALLAKFPTPSLNPDGGFKIEKALVYALVRQESRFQPHAVGGGALGLMQLTPATAARLGGSKAALMDPGANLKLGQAYVAKLLGAVKGDLLRAVAAYNTGSTAKNGVEGDSLLAMESQPGASTRSFVQNVMVAYWSYQHIFGGSSASLDAAARGKPIALASLD